MKEDILEQLVDGYFIRKPGVFTKHNVKYRPDQELDTVIANKNKYSVHSDIDVLVFDSKNDSVKAISCKSWQGGFNVKKYLEYLPNDQLSKTKK